MAAKKGKKQFQGADRRFRGDIWLDEKVSARTMYALKERGVKFPPGMNVRGTREFRDEFKRQLSKFKQEHAAKIAAKKEAAKAAQAAVCHRRNCSIINRYTICMGTDLYKQDLGSIPPVSRLWRVAPDAQKSPVPNWERGTGGVLNNPSIKRGS